MKKLFTLFAAIVLFACNKKSELEYTGIQYEQTTCADPWVNSINDSITIASVTRYFDSLNLYVAAINIQQVNPAQVCSACTCKTGKIIYVTTIVPEQDKFMRYGFR